MYYHRSVHHIDCYLFGVREWVEKGLIIVRDVSVIIGNLQRQLICNWIEGYGSFRALVLTILRYRVMIDSLPPFLVD